MGKGKNFMAHLWILSAVNWVLEREKLTLEKKFCQILVQNFLLVRNNMFPIYVQKNTQSGLHYGRATPLKGGKKLSAAVFRNSITFSISSGFDSIKSASRARANGKSTSWTFGRLLLAKKKNSEKIFENF